MTIIQRVKNPQSFGAKWAALYTNPALLEKVSDLTLVVDNTKYSLHRIVLCAASKVFHEICAASKKATHETVHLNETDDCKAVFDDFVEYVYTGCITLNLDTVHGIITLADKYQVDDLKKAACRFVEKHQPGIVLKCMIIAAIFY